MYDKLSPKTQSAVEKALSKRGLSPFAAPDKALRRYTDTHDDGDALRTPFVRDADKIINCPFFSRYADKTQVFSLVKNDDVSRRILHVQLVSRIARAIGKALSLNVDLIESIALGHDIGHTPFGHAGEHALNVAYKKRTGRIFAHNLQSVRVLDKIFNYNVTLYTLDGILTHDGELPRPEFTPTPIASFDEFDAKIKDCYEKAGTLKALSPSTLEAAVVRISDIIAYLGKDRQDAERMNVISEKDFTPTVIGDFNAEIINNLTVNIIENSIGKPYIRLDDERFSALKLALNENYRFIYNHPAVKEKTDAVLTPAVEQLFDKFLSDLKNGDLSSPIFSSHIAYVEKSHYKRDIPYRDERPEDIVCDFIASMTDDYFISVYRRYFPEESKALSYTDYF